MNLILETIRGNETKLRLTYLKERIDTTLRDIDDTTSDKAATKSLIDRSYIDTYEGEKKARREKNKLI